MKKAVIIGANGQDGSYLSSLLEKMNYSITKIDQNLIQPHINSSDYDTFDISNSSQVNDLVTTTKPNEVYYLAAFDYATFFL